MTKIIPVVILVVIWQSIIIIFFPHWWLSLSLSDRRLHRGFAVLLSSKERLESYGQGGAKRVLCTSVLVTAEGSGASHTIVMNALGKLARSLSPNRYALCCAAYIASVSTLYTHRSRAMRVYMQLLSNTNLAPACTKFTGRRKFRNRQLTHRVEEGRLTQVLMMAAITSQQLLRCLMEGYMHAHLHVRRRQTPQQALAFPRNFWSSWIANLHWQRHPHTMPFCQQKGICIGAMHLHLSLHHMPHRTQWERSGRAASGGVPRSRRAQQESDQSSHWFIYTLFSRLDFSEPFFPWLLPPYLKSDIFSFWDRTSKLSDLRFVGGRRPTSPKTG